jgi:DNA repair protein RadD
MSKGLIVQMIGRGARQAPAKQDCLVLDYAGNIQRHAPLDELWDTAKTPQRAAKDEREAREAQERARREQQARHLQQASLLDPLTGEGPDDHTYPVLGASYEVRETKNPRYKGRQMLVVRYTCPARQERNPAYPPYLWQWICVEHDGWARRQAEQWFHRRGLLGVPRTAAEARTQAPRLPLPTSLRVKEKEFPEVLLEYFEEREG